MSETQLNKEFSKRDVQRMRNIVTGNTADRTRVQAGYEKENKAYVEGDIWEENGKTWTIRDGLKQTITKHDKLRQIIVMPLKCPECEKAMKVNDLNKKMWSIHNKCFDCVVEYETHLRKIGKYEEYEKKLMNDNKNTFVDDFLQGPQRTEEAKRQTREALSKISPDSVGGSAGKTTEEIRALDKQRASDVYNESLKQARDAELDRLMNPVYAAEKMRSELPGSDMSQMSGAEREEEQRRREDAERRAAAFDTFRKGYESMAYISKTLLNTRT
jgi:hypothetical protein